MLTPKFSFLHVWWMFSSHRICQKPPPGAGLDLSCILCRFIFYVVLKSWSDIQVTKPQRSSDWRAVLEITQLLAQVWSAAAIEYLQGCRLRNLSWQPVPVFDHSHWKKKLKNIFLVFRWNFHVFRFVPLPFVPSLGTTEKIVALSAFIPTLDIYACR